MKIQILMKRFKRIQKKKEEISGKWMMILILKMKMIQKINRYKLMRIIKIINKLLIQTYKINHKINKRMLKEIKNHLRI